MLHAVSCCVTCRQPCSMSLTTPHADSNAQRRSDSPPKCMLTLSWFSNVSGTACITSVARPVLSSCIYSRHMEGLRNTCLSHSIGVRAGTRRPGGRAGGKAPTCRHAFLAERRERHFLSIAPESMQLKRPTGVSVSPPRSRTSPHAPELHIDPGPKTVQTTSTLMELALTGSTEFGRVRSKFVRNGLSCALGPHVECCPLCAAAAPPEARARADGALAPARPRACATHAHGRAARRARACGERAWHARAIGKRARARCTPCGQRARAMRGARARTLGGSVRGGRRPRAGARIFWFCGLSRCAVASIEVADRSAWSDPRALRDRHLDRSVALVRARNWRGRTARGRRPARLRCGHLVGPRARRRTLRSASAARTHDLFR